MKRTLEQALKTSGLETEIRNIIYHLVRTSNNADNKSSMQCVRFDHFMFVFFSPWHFLNLPNVQNSLTYLRKAGILWERRVKKSLNSMCNELEVTLQGQLRTTVEREELQNKWDELSNYQIGWNMLHCQKIHWTLQC